MAVYAPEPKKCEHEFAEYFKDINTYICFECDLIINDYKDDQGNVNISVDDYTEPEIKKKKSYHKQYRKTTGKESYRTYQREYQREYTKANREEINKKRRLRYQLKKKNGEL